MTLSDNLKLLIRRLANSVGYDLVAYDRANSRWRLAQLLKTQRINVIFDVGANLGHFGWDMRELGFNGKIVSFEPLADAFTVLKKTADADASWQAVNIGLGECDEDRLINVAANSQSSSFLPMLEAHQQAAPESLYERQQQASIRRLDGLFADYCGPNDKVFLKIDTQGFEKPVLEGARGILPAVPLIQLECSLVALYDGANLVEEMIGMMRSQGYDPVDALPTFYHRQTGHLMQADILFVRRT